MGLTARSTGRRARDHRTPARILPPQGGRVIALAGNPNVGKSTVFNGLTGMKQHTGNWPGKTVAVAQGRLTLGGQEQVLVDLPGTYSLFAHSAEEEVARDFLCFGDPDAVVVVCDATCLERNLNLVLQTLEISPRVLVCVNLMDEARRKAIRISPERLSRRLGVPVVGISARSRADLRRVMQALEALPGKSLSPCQVRYPAPVEQAAARLQAALQAYDLRRLSPRWLALRLLERDAALEDGLRRYLGRDILSDAGLREALAQVLPELEAQGYGPDRLRDAMVSALVGTAEEIAAEAVCRGSCGYSDHDRRLDRILTSRRTGYPLMLLLLLAVFFLTISVSNIPSGWLSALFGFAEEWLTARFAALGAPAWLHGLLVTGMFRTLGWVVSVMLPPMAIFFPLFTLLEDCGYLPRIAYNLDRPFRCCNACGKQALTMCMGFGCNAAGVVGCRIIDSPRERLLAVLTNSFVPCNGRLPALISVISMFLVGAAGGLAGSALSALLLTGVILLGVLMTFAATKLLSVTLLRGLPSSFTLELPPYRPPQVGRVIVRSIFDRTAFVLARAAAVALPAGMLLWTMANVTLEGASLLHRCAAFLDPFARLMGLDGVILIAFILGLPANEIVIPIILMGYLSESGLTEAAGLTEMRALFVANGWTWATAVCVMLFFLLHWPCSTTLLTVRKETGSWKWTALAAALPTAAGILLCMAFTAIVGLFT